MHFKNSYRQEGVQFSYEIILGGYGFHTPHFSETPPPWDVINDRSLMLSEDHDITRAQVIALSRLSHTRVLPSSSFSRPVT